VQKLSVHFSETKDVIQFVDVMNQFEYHCDLCCGSYMVDAKSLLGVISLQGSSNIELVIHADKAENLVENIWQYCG